MHKIIFNKSEAVIDDEGAFINSYKIDECNIFFPRQQIDNSSRGGCHVCLPNFGPGGDTDQAQHGYGRKENWQVDSVSSNKIKLSHIQKEGSYNGLISNIRYEINEDSLEMGLSCENRSSKELRITPGFHPYFNLESNFSGVVLVDGKEFLATDLAGTKFYQAGRELLADLGDKKVRIRSENLRYYALWTAHADKYVCIEPTLAGNAFSGRNPSNEEILKPGEVKCYNVKISVELSK